MSIRKQIFSYTGINILNSSIPFLLLPILTAYLHPSDYGFLSLIQLLMALSLPIVLMNTHSLLTIEYANLSYPQFQQLVSTIIWIPLFGFILLEIFFFLFKTNIILLFHIPEEYIFYIPLFVLFQVIPTIVPIVFQAKKEPLNFGKYKIPMTITNLLLSLFLVVILNMGWEGRLWGIVSAFLLFTGIGIIVLYRIQLLRFTFDKTLLVSSLNFGLPLIPHSLAGVFLTMSDRIFLANMLGTESVGIYSVAFQISSIITIIMTSINQAWAPNLFEKLNDHPSLESKIKIVKKIYKILGLMTITTFIFVLSVPLLYYLFIDNKYSDGQTISILIAIAFLIQGYYFMMTNFIFYAKKTELLSMITVFSVFMIFILNYYFISLFGIYGSAYAMIMGWSLFFSITLITANRVYPMPWKLHK